jgi:hypothetical protein
VIANLIPAFSSADGFVGANSQSFSCVKLIFLASAGSSMSNGFGNVNGIIKLPPVDYNSFRR